MDYALDYSFARPDPRAIKAAGYGGVLRYVSRPDGNRKNISKAEMDSLRAAGLDVTLNFEQYERRPLEGYAAGQADAATADSLADRVGYPRDCVIYYSVDFGTTWASVRDYFRGVKAASKRPVGIYAGMLLCHNAMDEGLAQFGWVTNAASWSGMNKWSEVQSAAVRSGRCHLLQHLHTNTPIHIPGVADTQFDPNTVLNADYGQWSSSAKPKPPTVQEDDLRLIRIKDGEPGAGSVAVTNGVFKRHVANPDDENFLIWIEGANGQKAVVVDCSKAQYDSIPDYVPGGASAPAKVDVAAIANAVLDALAKRVAA